MPLAVRNKRRSPPKISTVWASSYLHNTDNPRVHQLHNIQDDVISIQINNTKSYLRVARSYTEIIQTKQHWPRSFLANNISCPPNNMPAICRKRGWTHQSVRVHEKKHILTYIQYINTFLFHFVGVQHLHIEALWPNSGKKTLVDTALNSGGSDEKLLCYQWW